MLIAKVTRKVLMNWYALTFTAIFTLGLTGAVGVTISRKASFRPATGSPLERGIGDAPVSVVAGDFNKDGIIDLAVANSGDNSVSILWARETAPSHRFLVLHFPLEEISPHPLRSVTLTTTGNWRTWNNADDRIILVLGLDRWPGRVLVLSEISNRDSLRGVLAIVFVEVKSDSREPVGVYG